MTIAELEAKRDELTDFIAKTEMPKFIEEILQERLNGLKNSISNRYEVKYREEKQELMEQTETPENLLQFYSNAIKTWYGAGGHTKAEMNKHKSLYWEEVLKRRGITIPDKKDLPEGIFNGPGSV